MEFAGAQGPPPLESYGGVRTDYIKFIKVWHKAHNYQIGVTDPLRFGFADLVANIRAKWSNLIFPEDTLTISCEPNPGSPERIPIRNDYDMVIVMALPQVLINVHVLLRMSNEGIITRLLKQESRIKQLEDALLAGQQNPPAMRAAELGAQPQFQGQGQ